MRSVITAFLALLLWGYASFSAGHIGLPKWIPAMGLVLVGVVVQLMYARLVNRHLDASGMPETLRLRLRSDRGVVPLWIAAVGIAARSLLVAGVIMPVLEATGCIVRGTFGPGP